MGAAESKATFRKGVFRLFEEKNISPTADEYWTSFWTIPGSAGDIYSLIGASDIRKARDSARENIETLIDKAINRIETIVNMSAESLDQESVKQLLNGYRILTRIMPYIYESADNAGWENDFFWTPRLVRPEDQTSELSNKANPANVTTEIRSETMLCRGEQLLDLTIQCMFLAGFTLPSSLATQDTRVVPSVWEKGVGSSTSPGTSKEIEAHRIEVLNLFLVLLSKSMYIAPTALFDGDDRWLAHVATKVDNGNIKIILCSLLNTACGYDPVGWGLPYNHVVMADPSENLAMICLRVLLILLDYQSPREIQSIRQRERNPLGANKGSEQASPTLEQHELKNMDMEEHDDVVASGSASAEPFLDKAEDIPNSSKTDMHDNPFKLYLSKLHKTQDFEFLKWGIYRVLWNPIQANNTYLWGSTKRVKCHVEMLIFSWRLIEINPRFREYLMKEGRALELMVIVMCYATESKFDIAQDGLVRTCVFILQTLSSDPTFAESLNTTYGNFAGKYALSSQPVFSGSYGDFFVISICSLVTSKTEGRLASLHQSLILSITNVSPYLEHLSITAANKLLALFKATSSPRFLLAKEANHALIIFLLEALNNIIQYQYSVNTNVVYAIVRDHHNFYKLRDLTMSSAKADIEKKRNERKQQEKMQVSKAPVADTVDSITTVNESEGKTGNSGTANTAGARVETEDAMGEAVNDRPNTTPPSPLSTETTENDKENEAVNQFYKTHPSPADTERTVQETPMFVPTEAWMAQWHSQLPLSMILALLNDLVPKVEAKCAAEPQTTDGQLYDFLGGIPTDGILPPPMPVSAREFIWSEAVAIWFRSLLWGNAYVTSAFTYGAWNGTHVKLFQIKPWSP